LELEKKAASFVSLPEIRRPLSESRRFITNLLPAFAEILDETRTFQRVFQVDLLASCSLSSHDPVLIRIIL
jgi:hypothetical protein